MIRLDTQTNQKAQILELLGNALDNDSLELECSFNNSDSKNNYTVTHDNFMSILKRFKNNPDFETKTISKLVIAFPRKSKFTDIRMTINGVGAINSFCNTENLTPILNSVNFEYKQRSNTRINRLIIPNYNIKFNIKDEQNFNNDEAKIKDIIHDWNDNLKNYRYKKTFSFIKKTGDFQIDISIVKNSTTIDRFITVEEVIKNNMLNFVVKPDNVKMHFSAWWKTIEHKPHEKVMIRDGENYFENIKTSKVFDNLAHYEVEIEYIHNKTTTKPTFKNAELKKTYLNTEFTNFFRIIGSVLQCIQGSSFIISNEEKLTVKKAFTKVVIDSIDESFINISHQDAPRDLQYRHEKQHGGYNINTDGDIEFQSSDTTDSRQIIKDNHADDVDDTDAVQSGGNITRKLAELRSMITETFRRQGVFFGPLIIDLLHNNALPLDPTALPDIKTNTNIHINYLVTDKTDGERYLLFIDENGNTYGIDRESNIKILGIQLPSLANSILDGELVTRSEDNKILNNFYIFDAYIHKGTAIINKPFLLGKPNGRHNAILETIKYFNTGSNIIQHNPKMPFMLYKKDYLQGDSYKSYQKLYHDEIPLISQNCESLLNKMNVKYGGNLEVGHLFTYKTDGLVFLPNNLGVFQQYEGDQLSHLRGNPFVRGRWNNNYKWKPADHLTIDFRADFVRDIDQTAGKLSYRYIGDKKYLLVKLKSAVYQSYRGDNNALNFYLLNSGINIQNIPQSYDFFAVEPFIGHFDNEGTLQNYMSETFFEVDNNDNVICENGDIINDGQIIECSYNVTIKDEQYRWYPHRVRADKNDPNNYLTAVTTWKLINNPITKHHLCGKHSNTNNDGIDVLDNVTYYIDNKHTVILTKPLNDFNGFVKQYLINRILGGYVKPRVMDLATGKGGDIFKYVSAGVHTLIGIEIGYDGLNNPVDGAATRIINASKSNPAVAKLADRTLLIVGNATQNIANGDCVRDNLNKYYIDVLYGRAKGNTPKLKKLEATANDQFDCITCMYAIHYMMNNEHELDNFLRNVSENLLDQGYFIGTCLDGMSILKTMGANVEISGIIDGKTVFLIKKLDYQKDKEEITVGNKISVYYEKFAGQFTENLVNMSYLKERAKEHNLQLIEYKTFMEEPGNMLSQYEHVDSKNAKKIRDSDAMTIWGQFNAYFIFQKIRNDKT